MAVTKPSADHRGHATIRHVADLAGVSLKSVSRVINDEPGVSVELTERVNEAIERLGYRRNLAASALRRRGQRTRSIGVVLQDISNPFSATVLRAVEEVALDRGDVVLASSIDGSAQREAQVVAEMVRRRVDGMILMPTSTDHAHLAADQRLGMHLVFIDRPPIGLQADYVGSDNVGGAAQAVSAMLGRGHRRVAYLGDARSISTATERYEGYRRAHRTAGLDVDEALVVHDLHTPEAAQRAAMQLFASKRPPTAIFSAQNQITLAVLHVLRDLELRDSIAHIGFDDVELSDLLSPGLTVARQSTSTIGHRAAELLFARLDGEQRPPSRTVLPVEIVERGSGELRLVRFDA